MIDSICFLMDCLIILLFSRVLHPDRLFCLACTARPAGVLAAYRTTTYLTVPAPPYRFPFPLPSPKLTKTLHVHVRSTLTVNVQSRPAHLKADARPRLSGRCGWSLLFSPPRLRFLFLFLHLGVVACSTLFRLAKLFCFRSSSLTSNCALLPGSRAHSLPLSLAVACLSDCFWCWCLLLVAGACGCLPGRSVSHSPPPLPLLLPLGPQRLQL
jgi:hypothetical protein